MFEKIARKKCKLLQRAANKLAPPSFGQDWDESKQCGMVHLLLQSAVGQDVLQSLGLGDKMDSPG